MNRLWFTLIFTSLFFFILGGQTFAEQKTMTVVVENRIIDFQQQPLNVSGRIFIPLRDFSKEWKMKVNYDDEKKLITLIHPNQWVELSLKDKKDTIVKNGVTYVPLRFLSEEMHANIRWDAQAQTVFVEGNERFAYGEVENRSFWITYKTGELYVSNGLEKPKKIGTINHELYDLVGINAVKMEEDTFAIKVFDNYGEPHIHHRIFTMVIKNDKILHQEQSYFQHNYVGSDLLIYNDLAVLHAGKSIKLVNAKGELVKEIALAIQGDEQNYDLIALKPTYLLIRGNEDGLLIYVNRTTGERIKLYKELITNKEELEYIENGGNVIPGDQLIFVKEQNGSLLFSYEGLFESGSYQFEIQTN